MFLNGIQRLSSDEALELLVGLRTYQLTRLVRVKGEEKLHGIKEGVFSFVGQVIGRFDERLSQQIEEARQKFDWNVASLEQISQEERARLEGLDSQEIKSQLRHELVSISGERFSVDDMALERKIVADVADLYKIDTAFRSLEDVEREEFCRFIQELIERIQRQLDQMSPEKVALVEQRLFENLSKLPESEREIIKREMDLPELSERQLLQNIRTQGSSLTNRMLSDHQGYGIYLALMAATHAVFTTLMGITMPFAFYNAMATLVGFLLGPLGIALITIGGGSYFFKRAQSEYNANLLAFAMVNLMIQTVRP